ncbi:hypothetical protein MIR68_008276 [Amoeboaphelidium protococcarum]|nr:hypothetical protein MIR68_008276 [Amoeboaphelidium protococcarum]KAI3644544.1 hypothetical protein MP228_010708 [Amoeboaphelidium protococcarum]
MTTVEPAVSHNQQAKSSKIAHKSGGRNKRDGANRRPSGDRPAGGKTRTIDQAIVAEAKALLQSGKRPEKPDQILFDRKQKDLQNDIDKLKVQLDKVRAKIDAESNESPAGQARSELKAQLDAVKLEQAEHEAKRARVSDELKAAQELLRKKQDELKAARDKLPFKSASEVDRRCDELEKLVSSGSLPVNEEKKVLSEISNLKRQKKQLDVFNPKEDAIEEQKRRVDSLRDTLSSFDPESRRLKQLHGKTYKELKVVEEEQKENRGKLKKIYDERNDLQKKQNDLNDQKRQLAREYYAKKDLFNAFMNEERKRRDIEMRKQRQEMERKKRLERVKQARENAEIPAFSNEIKTCNALMILLSGLVGGSDLLDAEILGSVAASQDSKMTVKAPREVTQDAILPKGFTAAVEYKKKEDLDEVTMQIGGKKAKAAKVNKAEKEKDLRLDLGVLDQFWNLKIDAPSGRADVPKTIEALKQKRVYFLENQDRVTKENIQKATELEAKLLAEEEKYQKEQEEKAKSGKADSAADEGNAPAADNGDDEEDNTDSVDQE